MEHRIIHLRLINSDEVIGELSSENENELFIQRPMMVSEVTDSNTQISTIVLSKYVLFHNETPVPIKKNHVITTTDILDEIKNYYFNSIQYNTKFVEPIVKAELSKVNNVMENLLNQSAMLEDVMNRQSEGGESFDSIKYLAPSSNTVN